MTSTDDACEVVGRRGAVGHRACSRSRTPATQVTEFYLLGEDGLRIVGEVENIGPGLTRDLVVQAAPGHLLHGLQAGHGRRRHPRGRSRSPTPART